MLLLLTFGFGYLMNAHVRVDIFRDALSRKAQAWFELFAIVVMAIPFLGFMIYYSWIFVAISYEQGEGSESMTGIPWRYGIKAFMLIGFTVALMAVLATLARLLVYLFGPPDEKEAAHQSLVVFAHEDPASRALEEAHAAAERAVHDARVARREVRKNDRDAGGR